MADVFAVTAVIGALSGIIGTILGIYNILTRRLENRPKLKIEIQEAKRLSAAMPRFEIELLVHNKGEKLTAITSTEYNLLCIGKTKTIDYDQPLFLSPNSSRRLNDSFECEELPESCECEIEINMRHTHGECKLKEKIQIESYQIRLGPK